MRHALAALTFLSVVAVACAAAPTPSVQQSPVPLRACHAVGCDVPLLTQPPPHPAGACEAARIGGWLTRDETFGLGVRDAPEGGTFYGVIWPNGYGARVAAGGVIVLLDRRGRLVAQEGDRIVMAGVHRLHDRIQVPCHNPDVEVE